MGRTRTVADRMRSAGANACTVRPTPLLVAAIMFALVGCSGSNTPSATTPEPIAAPAPTTATVTPMSTTVPAQPALGPAPAQPRLASDPAQLADDLVADEQALRNPSSSEAALVAAARRQQAAYRAIGWNSELDAVVRPRIPAALMDTYDRNVDARRQLNAMSEVKDTLPAWRIVPPPPAGDLMAYYRESEAANGVGWNYLAAINLIETRFGSIAGTSTAGAQGPMQFMPSTWAAYGEGDVNSPRDSIMAAGRYLAANGFANDPDHAIFRYNNAYEYVEAVKQYAAVLANDPAAFGGYYRWDVYYRTTEGDVLLPIGYSATSRISAAEYLATHPQ